MLARLGGRSSHDACASEQTKGNLGTTETPDLGAQEQTEAREGQARRAQTEE